jgi:hypothetical protein
MKSFKRYNFLILVFCIMFSISCDDYLITSSNSKFTEETAFENLDFATKQVYGAYERLTQLYDYYLIFFKLDSDIEHSYGANDGARIEIAHMASSPGNSILKQMWTLLYQTIERSNIAIDNLPKSDLWTGEYSKEAKRLYGEALTIRALCYYELVTLWGDVPFVTESAQAGNNFYVSKTDRDEIYEALIKDLNEAEQYVPWISEARTAERVTKGFVKGLKARLAMSYSGYSLRNKTHETKRGRNWEEYYQIARKECRELIESNKHSLNPDYQQIFRNIHAYKQDLQFGEILFEIAFGRMFSGRVAQSFGMRFRTTPADPKYGRATGEINTNIYYYYSFDRNDLRRNTNVELYDYNNASNLSKQWPVSNAFSLTPSKWRRSWITPLMGGDLKEVTKTGVNWPVMRYTDVILMFAEAENEINGPTQSAKDALKSVRKRAFSPELWPQKVEQYVDSVSQNKELFFKAIVDERSWEFGGELIRKYDLIRWNLLGDKLEKMRDVIDNIVNRPNDPPYNFVPTYLFWKHKSDNETIEILNPDYRLPDNAIEGYTRTVWFSGLSRGAINTAYDFFDRVANGYDKDKNNHLYPIHNDLIVSSNGALSNDQIP